MASNNGLTWGVNGHPLTSYPEMTTEQQLSLSHQLGFTSYRVDVYDSSQRSIAALTQLENQAKPLGISIVPVLAPAVSDFGSPADAYQWGHDTAAALASALPSLTWELGNELDDSIIKPGASGASPSDYNNTGFSIASAVDKGMSDGIKTDINAKTILGITGLHPGFLQRLAADGVTWDTTGLTYYVGSGADAPTANSQLQTAFAQLTQFGHPIAITEFNQVEDGSSPSQRSVSNMLTTMMQEISANASSYNVTSAYVYQLLDQPGLPAGEAGYGLATSNGTLKLNGQAVETYLLGS